MYSYTTRVRYSESDKEGRLTEVGLLDYLQDCAIFHSEDIGYGVGYMAEHHVAWLLGSWQIDVKEMPLFGERIVIDTYPYQFKGFVGCRCFIVRSQDGQREYARANSVWSYVNMETMKPQVVNEEMMAAYGLDEKIDMEYCGKKLRPDKEAECHVMPEIVIGPQHIDTNNHVNNGQYVHIASAYIGRFFHEHSIIKRIKAEYKQQVHLDDVLVPKVYIHDSIMLVSLEDKSGKICTNVEYTF